MLFFYIQGFVLKYFWKRFGHYKIFPISKTFYSMVHNDGVLTSQTGHCHDTVLGAKLAFSMYRTDQDRWRLRLRLQTYPLYSRILSQ